MFDTMRGWGADQGSNDAWLEANDSSAEYNNTNSLGITPTGFTSFNGGDATYIYIAIRRGPMAVPESADDVFAMDTRHASNPAFVSGFPVDFTLWKDVDAVYSHLVFTRLLGQSQLETANTNAEVSGAGVDYRDYYNTGIDNGSGNDSTRRAWMWRRAPNYFDVVAYSGNGTAGHQIKHNLGVAPDMVWLRSRDLTKDWRVWHKDIADSEDGLYLNNNFDVVNSLWFNIDVTGNTGYIELNQTGTNFNGSGNTYIAYLFASLDGVSKVGSYTGDGSSQTIDCGFSSGARFVLIKRTDSTGDWYVWDTERGIVAGNDPYLELNTTDAQVTSTDWVDPDNSGFIVNGTTVNASSAEYIFYAVA